MIPKILIESESYLELKHLPHIEPSSGLICTFDNLARPDPMQPQVVVVEVLNRAKSILRDGIEKRNKKDFLDEFQSYWSYKYSSKDKVVGPTMMLIENDLDDKFKVIISNASVITVVIHQDEEIALIYKDYLTKNGINFSEL